MNLLEENYKKIIRKYSTYDLLKFFSEKSIESYINNDKGYTMIDLGYYIKNCGIRFTQKFSYGQWDLLQVCYDSIRFSNDYIGKKVEMSDFYLLINEAKRYNEQLEATQDFSGLKLFEHIQCLTNIQLDFQIFNIINKFNRMHQIMMDINKNPKYCQTREVCYIDFDYEFEKITGMKYIKFINIYFFLVLFSSSRKNTNIYDIIEDIKFDIEKIGFTKEELLKVIKLQSKDYEFYRKSNNWNKLRYYPIVKTNKRENTYIISNIYALLLSLPDMMYWTIRNYYAEIKSNDFTNYFGKCFEYYVQEILENYKIKGEKLKERDVKIPDWKIETNNYIFLIEQKSALLPIDTRIVDNEIRYKKMEEYFERNVVKAFNQLNTYDVQKNRKKVIRICLMFESLYLPEDIMFIVESDIKFNSDKKLNWILNINEFEILMELLSKDENKFDELIEKKISLEYEDSKKGKSFRTI